MNEFLEAVAQTLRNLGFEGAVASDCAVQLSGIRFEAWERGRRSFQFCGRTYKSGNVQTAVLDLIRQLPSLVARREREVESRREQMRLEALNKSLESHGIQIVCAGAGSYYLTYRASLERLEEVAKQIANAQEVSFAPIDGLLAKLNATFTSEGGFSLN